MQKARKFTFGKFYLDAETGTFSSEYEVTFASGSKDIYTNHIRVENSDLLNFWPQVPVLLCEKLLQTLHLAFGITYWKMHCAPEIEIKNFSLSSQEKEFWETFYTKGLGEFFYKNQIDFRGLVNFPVGTNTALPVRWQRSDQALVGIGGGKDSLVAIELLKSSGLPHHGFTLNEVKIQREAAIAAGIDSYNVLWRVDPKLFQYSDGEIYHGHIPYTGLYSFVGVFLAAILDYKYVVMGSERSANFGNLEYLGEKINHQWSKSEEFEILFKNYVHNFITPDILPFSILRPFSELQITRQFIAKPKYFKSFSSCNLNFHSGFSPLTRRFPYWCGQCPKCLFVFTCLSAFLDQETLVDIFGHNLYENGRLIPLTEELLGIRNHKPFECVGTPDEMLVALFMAQEKTDYQDSVVVRSVSQYISSRERDLDDLKRQVFSISRPTLWPGEIIKRMEAASLSQDLQ